ncbi:ABC-type sugar transport system ATPase subunit [Paraburkholderia youngii]
MDTLLKLDNISKSFPGVKALQGIHLEIARGEIHALLGENGAGKSTLMKILCGIYQPDEGTITLDGEPRHFANYHDAVAAGVGIVFQEFSLIPYLNAVENMFLGREMRNRFGLLERARMRRAAAARFLSGLALRSTCRCRSGNSPLRSSSSSKSARRCRSMRAC